MDQYHEISGKSPNVAGKVNLNTIVSQLLITHSDFNTFRDTSSVGFEISGEVRKVLSIMNLSFLSMRRTAFRSTAFVTGAINTSSLHLLGI